MASWHTAKKPYTPTWRKVVGNNPCRCTHCGSFVTTTWRWYPKPDTWTLALCEPCVEQEIGEH